MKGGRVWENEWTKFTKYLKIGDINHHSILRGVSYHHWYVLCE